MPLAKITDRFIAYLIDTVPFVIGYYFSAFYLILRQGRLPNEPTSWNKMALIWLLIYVGYHAYGNWRGATIGKAILGLRVVTQEGESVGAGRALARALGLLISTPLFNLGFLWSLIQADSRGWHDLLASTVVVEEAVKEPGELQRNAFISMALLCGVFLFGFWGASLQPNAGDIEAIERAQNGLMVLAKIQERHKARHGTYAGRLIDLARASGDPARFRESMGELFSPAHFRLKASRDRYVITARALDRRGTTVTLAGP